MTREEKMRQLQSLRDHCRSMVRDEYKDGIWVQDIEALDAALSVLRPVSQEQVEKVWRGGWKQGGYACGEHEWECSKCHETEWRTSCSRLKFCPFCGAPMTDEAVETVMERLEALKDGVD